jgi:hypothetical protein
MTWGKKEKLEKKNGYLWYDIPSVKKRKGCNMFSFLRYFS